jgi:hypothetical protein
MLTEGLLHRRATRNDRRTDESVIMKRQSHGVVCLHHSYMFAACRLQLANSATTRPLQYKMRKLRLAVVMQTCHEQHGIYNGTTHGRSVYLAASKKLAKLRRKACTHCSGAKYSTRMVKVFDVTRRGTSASERRQTKRHM